MIKKKSIYRMLISIITLIIIGIVYLNTNHFIRKQEWKHRDGGSIGDWIEFDNTVYSVRGSTIYKNNIAAGKIVFCFGKMLIVKEIKNGEKGYYINKTNF